MMTEHCVYQGFLPHDSDGNAQIKTEYIIEKKKEERPIVSEVAGKKHKKARGQNKNRPRPQREILTEKLCPSRVNNSGVCAFGEKCKYIHDVTEFMKIKPEDIGAECISFRKLGKCQYSFACRYGREHIAQSEEGYKNLTNDKLVASVTYPVVNVLSRDLQMNLRKRKIDFPKSDNAMKILEKVRTKRRKIHHDKTKESAVNGNENKNLEQAAGDKQVEKEGGKKSEADPGALTDEDLIPLRSEEKKTIDFSNKLYLAPLTTCGNLPFRVVCKRLGADITCGEMAVSTCLLQAQTSEWALIKRHSCEDIFGVQLCGAFPDTMSRCAELLNKNCEVDFIDVNMGCPIDLIYKKGAGSALMRRANKLFDIVTTMNRVMDIPLTCKMRAGIETDRNCAHSILPMLRDCGVSMAAVHGRSREARYTKVADWGYIDQCARISRPMPLFGNGDVLSYRDYYSVMDNTSVAGIMIARGALIKPWIFTEIKERRDWDISSSERFSILKGFVDEGLMHWGSDSRGVEITRRFLLEWCSFLHRYIPVGLLERLPQRINERPSYYQGRNDLETLMASPNSNDWVKISEMFLGKVPDSFNFLPKHKANSYK